jgi:hypothetical protein
LLIQDTFSLKVRVLYFLNTCVVFHCSIWTQLIPPIEAFFFFNLILVAYSIRDFVTGSPVRVNLTIVIFSLYYFLILAFIWLSDGPLVCGSIFIPSTTSGCVPEFPHISTDIAIKYCKTKIKIFSDLEISVQTVSDGTKALLCFTLLGTVARRSSVVRELLLKPPLLLPKLVATKLPVIYYGLTTTLLVVGLVETGLFLEPSLTKYYHFFSEKGKDIFTFVGEFKKPSIPTSVEISERISQVPDPVQVPKPTQIGPVNFPDVVDDSSVEKIFELLLFKN